jgi:MFS family permease
MRRACRCRKRALPTVGSCSRRFSQRRSSASSPTGSDTALLLTFGTLLLSLTFLLLGTTHFSLWISTAMMGISFSVVPAIIWPATAMLVDAKRLGLALGLINTVQNAALAASNIFAGWLNDAAGARSGGLRCHALVLRHPEPHRVGRGRTAVAPRIRAAWPWPGVGPASRNRLAPVRS